MVKRAEFQGTCAVCQGTFKVREQRLVLHGYQRPGDGYITGRCWGEGAVPWEISPEAATHFLTAVLRPNLARLDASMAQYASGTVTLIVRLQRQSYMERQRGATPVTLTFTPESPEWAMEFERAKRAVDAEQQYYARMVAEFETRIGAWTPGTLVPVVIQTKHLKVSFERGVWIARSVKSGRTIEQGRLIAGVLARAKWNGWTLPPGAEIPAEIKTSDLYRAVVEHPAAPETQVRVGWHNDHQTASAVLGAYERLTPAQRAKFDVLPLPGVWKIVQSAHGPSGAVRVEAVHAMLVPALG